MRRSSKLRLPRGKRSPKASPMMMGIAIFLVILVPTIFYLFPTGEDTKSSISLSSDQDSGIENPSVSSPARTEKEDPQSSSSEPVLRIASSDVSLLAVVNSSPNLSQVHLENNGITKLHRIKVTDRDRSLGTLSELDPGEKKVLSISGRAEKLSVFALDPTGLEIQGRVKYNSTKQEKNASEDVGLETIFDPLLFSMSIPAGGAIPAEAEVPIAEEPVIPAIPQNSSSTSLALNISVNRSALPGRRGDKLPMPGHKHWPG